MFLSVYTPTYKRPNLLAMCRASVKAQTIPCQHVIVHDKVGIGVDGMFEAIRDHAHLCAEDYVMVLSDDNVLTDREFARDLKAEVAIHRLPDVVMFKGEIAGQIQPVVWGSEPLETKVDLSCFAVRNHIWQRHAPDWGHRYEGDFDFIHTLWERGYRFHWWDREVFRAQLISRGQPEAA